MVAPPSGVEGEVPSHPALLSTLSVRTWEQSVWSVSLVSNGPQIQTRAGSSQESDKQSRSGQRIEEGVMSVPG